MHPSVLPSNLHDVAECWPCYHVRGCLHASTSVRLSCPALLSSHNQWPFSLRWWMREKCSASKQACTYSSLFPCLPIFLAFLVFLTMHPLLSSFYMLSPWRSTTYTAVSLCLYMCTLVECRHMHACFPMQSCDSPSLPVIAAWFAVAIIHRSRRPSICGWCWVLSLVCLLVCVLSPGQSEEWDSRL